MARRNFPGSGDSLETVESALMATQFVEDVPSVEIRDQIVYFTWPDGRKIGAPLRVCRAGVARVTAVLKKYDGKKADVVPIRGKRGGHAASP